MPRIKFFRLRGSVLTYHGNYGQFDKPQNTRLGFIYQPMVLNAGTPAVCLVGSWKRSFDELDETAADDADVVVFLDVLAAGATHLSSRVAARPLISTRRPPRSPRPSAS